MPNNRLSRLVRSGIALPLLLATAAHANVLCGGDFPEEDSDLSLKRTLEKPASMTTCAQGYLLEKCGDHASAHIIFDKCIAAGYIGAMIWKGLMYEDGAGVPQDSAKAAAMFKRAAESGSGDYATLGKLHYASALYEGRGVPKDEAAAMKWFQAAADEGSEEAREFIATGHHTGSRDRNGVGVGIARTAVEGQHLERSTPAPVQEFQLWPLLLLAAALVAGALRQTFGHFTLSRLKPRGASA